MAAAAPTGQSWDATTGEAKAAANFDQTAPFPPERALISGFWVTWMHAPPPPLINSFDPERLEEKKKKKKTFE